MSTEDLRSRVRGGKGRMAQGSSVGVRPFYHFHILLEPIPGANSHRSTRCRFTWSNLYTQMHSHHTMGNVETHIIRRGVQGRMTTRALAWCVPGKAIIVVWRGGPEERPDGGKGRAACPVVDELLDLSSRLPSPGRRGPGSQASLFLVIRRVCAGAAIRGSASSRETD